MATAQVPSGGNIDVASLLNLLGGQKTTQTGTANTSGLQAILGQTLQPTDPAAQLAALFSQAQGQMPALAAARSNAVGARTGRNSSIVNSSDELLQNTVLKAQAQIAQQEAQRQATAASAASALAQATRGSTTQQGTNLPRVAGVLGLLQAGNNLADSRLGKKTGELFSKGFDSLQNSILGPAPEAIDPAAGNFVMQSAGNIDPNTFGLDQFAQSFGDVSNLASGAGALADVASNVSQGSDLSDWGSQFADIIGLKDGGLIGRDDVRQRKAMKSYKPKGYADGGMVRQQSPGGRASSAPSYLPDLIQRSTAVNTIPALRSPGAQASQTTSTGGSDGSNGDGVSGAAGVSGNSGLTVGNVLGLLSSVLSQNPLGVISAINSISNNSMAANAAEGTTAAAAVNGMSVANADGSVMSVPSDAPSFTPAADVFAEAANAAAAADAATSDSDAGTVGGGSGSDAGGTGGPGSGSGSGSDGGSDGGDGGGDGGGYANGGKLYGPGTGTSDSIPINVSKGEYIVPADVVQKLGTAFFDNLRANFHMPADEQDDTEDGAPENEPDPRFKLPPEMKALDTDDSNGDDVG